MLGRPLRKPVREGGPCGCHDATPTAQCLEVTYRDSRVGETSQVAMDAGKLFTQPCVKMANLIAIQRVSETSLMAIDV
jgi:hypothetical protein